MSLVLGYFLEFLFVLIPTLGTTYAFWNWREARRDRLALSASYKRDSPVLNLVAQGHVDDQRRVTLAQASLVLAGAFLIATPYDPAAPISWSGLASFLAILACSSLLSYKSFRQNKRRVATIRLIRATVFQLANDAASS